MGHVLDASCLSKLFLDQPGCAEFRTWFHGEVEAVRALEAPSIARYELGRVLQKCRPEAKLDLLGELLEGSLRRVRLAEPSGRGVFKVAAAG
jgi:hypothetical protein